MADPRTSDAGRAAATTSVRRRRWLLRAALVLLALQAVLPGIHILIDHIPATAAVIAVGSGPSTDSDDDDGPTCGICAMLQASGGGAPPPDSAGTADVTVIAAIADPAPPFVLPRDPPDMRCAPTRGPPGG